jgi:hypothetical protein
MARAEVHRLSPPFARLIFYRLLMGHAALDGKFMDAVVEHALKGLRDR